MPVRPVSIGDPIKRREDPRLIRGLATYTDDLVLPGMLHCAFVRSDYPAGTISRIDASRALAREGVVAVYTYDDLRGEVGRTPCVARMDEARDVEHPLLADGQVRYVGQPVVVVVARDRYPARDGALDVDVEPRPCVVDPLRALEPDAPRVYEQFPDNVNARVEPESEAVAATDAAFAAADRSFSLTVRNQRVAPVPIEGRAVVAHWDEGLAKLTVWMSTQVPHQAKQQIAMCLGLPEIRVRVIAPEVGGGFGCKLPVYPEDCLLPWISRRLDKPVKWAETRTENLLNTSHGRGQLHEVEIAYNDDGRVLALRGRLIAEVGAYPSYLGAAIATFTPLMVPGCYRVRALALELVNVYTNTMATDAYRGAGRPEAAFLIEKVMDRVARELELDPVEVRRRNFIAKDAFPYQTAGGAEYDSGDYQASLALALERFDYEGERAEQARARAEGRLVGIGLGARVTHARLARGEELADAPILSETAALIGDVQVRNRGTIGGSLVHADPAADWPAVFLALEGEAVVIGTKGERTIAAGDFFAGMLQSALRPDELLTEVRLELPRKRCGAAYTKMRQPASGFAIVGVAARVETDRKGRCERAAVAISGVNPVPFRARGVESRLLGRELGEESLRQALAEIEELDPMADIHASAEYRGELARVYTTRALARASARARA